MINDTDRNAMKEKILIVELLDLSSEICDTVAVVISHRICSGISDKMGHPLRMPNKKVSVKAGRKIAEAAQAQ